MSSRIYWSQIPLKANSIERNQVTLALIIFNKLLISMLIVKTETKTWVGNHKIRVRADMCLSSPPDASTIKGKICYSVVPSRCYRSAGLRKMEKLT